MSNVTLHNNAQELVGALAAGGAITSPWMDTLGARRLAYFLAHTLFTGTVTIEGSYNGVDVHGTVATVTAGAFDVDGFALCCPYIRWNVSVFTTGEITGAWLYGIE